MFEDENIFSSGIDFKTLCQVELSDLHNDLVSHLQWMLPLCNQQFYQRGFKSICEQPTRMSFGFFTGGL